MKLRVQIGVGLLVAALLVALLQWWVSDSDSEAVDPTPMDPRSPAADETLAPDLAAEGRGVLDGLQGVVDDFHLAPDRELLPKGCAPVLKILPGGTIQIPVAPPIVSAPGAIRWSRIGIVLPQSRVADLSPSERASLTQIWSRLAGGATIRPDRIQVHGCEFAPGELALLLRWMR